MGILQHHDAVAGTEKQWVADDYVYILHNATVTMNKVMAEILKEQTGMLLENEDIDNFAVCNVNYTSAECETVYDALTNNKAILVTLYNPTYERVYPVRIKVPNVPFAVIDHENKQV